jgi:hypothetical protein
MAQRLLGSGGGAVPGPKGGGAESFKATYSETFKGVQTFGAVF